MWIGEEKSAAFRSLWPIFWHDKKLFSEFNSVKDPAPALQNSIICVNLWSGDTMSNGQSDMDMSLKTIDVFM